MRGMIVAAAAAALSVTGCASMGTNYSESAVQSLKPGMTQREVIALMGEPNSRVRLDDGREQLGWTHSTANAFGSAKARAIYLGFDANGRYNGKSSSSQMKSR